MKWILILGCILFACGLVGWILTSRRRNRPQRSAPPIHPVPPAPQAEPTWNPETEPLISPLPVIPVPEAAEILEAAAVPEMAEAAESPEVQETAAVDAVSEITPL